jgi:uncharacterized protein YecE (DUF72 family)
MRMLPAVERHGGNRHSAPGRPGTELHQGDSCGAAHACRMAGHAYIGTSGWNYEIWRELFYEGRPAREWLHYCAARFSAIEVNATFYRLQGVETFRRWRNETPADFRFAIKAHRYLTHNKKLSDPLPAIRLERERASGLSGKLAAVVWQLPHNLHRNVERLEGFARALRCWRRARHAIEFRHVSWFDEQVAACLRTHRIAVCQSDAADWPLWDAVTTDLVYVRLHGHELTYASCYPESALRTWADKVCRWTSEGRDVHVYFDNDAYGDAPWNAMRLIELVRGKS